MTPEERKEQFVKSLKRFTKKHPTLYGLNTKELESLMTDIAGVESSYRSNVVGKTKDGKKSKYNGYYALKIPANTSVEEQHRKAFEHLSEVLKHNITDVDVYRAGQLGISQAQLVGKYWNQRNRVTNYLWNGIDTTDGNGVKISEYGTNHGDYRITSKVDILRYVPDAIMDSEYKVKKGDTFSEIQERVRTDGRNHNKAGKDILKIEENKNINPDTLKIGQIIKTQPNVDIRRSLTISNLINNTPNQIPLNVFPSRIPFRKYGGLNHIRYGWGGIMSEDDYNFNHAVKGGEATPYDGWAGYEEDIPFNIVKGIDPNGNVYNRDEILKLDTIMNPVPLTLYRLPDPTQYDSYKLKSVKIYNNMQDRIQSDISRHSKINTNSTQTMRFGGYKPLRRMYELGGSTGYTRPYQPTYSGNVSWGMQVKPEDIHYSSYNADGEGIIGSEVVNKAGMIGGIGAGIGTMAGAAAGGALGAWGGPLGMLFGAGLGALVGLFTGKSKKREEEKQRRQMLAEQLELNRQTTMGNMESRHENDVARIRTFNNGTSFENNSFYSKFGGMLKRRRLEYGGHIIPNSVNTAVAYGRTHEQVNPMTGETGITYGNAEVEGGGLVRNKELPGEVIQQTPNGDRIYSDSLYVPGTRATYAQIAKALTDKKGVIEKEISTLQETLDTSLDTFNKAKLSKAKSGTATRNIEKLASKLNLKTGELAQVDAQLNDVFGSQEQMATALGLRDITPVTARFGGYRPKYEFGFNEGALVGNIGLAGLSFLGNELTGRSNLAQLEFMRKLPVPKQSHVEAEYYNTDYDISNEIAMAAAQYNRNRRFITDNSSNVQISRNAIRKTDIDFLSAFNELKASKKKYQTERFDLNRNARIQANNINRQIDYNNLIAEYNKNMDYYKSVMGVQNQIQANRIATINQLTDALSSYGNTRLEEGKWEEGVRNSMHGIRVTTKQETVKGFGGKQIIVDKGVKIKGKLYYDGQKWRRLNVYRIHPPTYID